MFTIDRSIYDGTILDGIPFQYRYQESKPKSIYKVNKSGSIVAHGYRGWNDIPENPTVNHLRGLFLHDTSHTILYFLRGDYERIFKSDFGLNWKYVNFLNPHHAVFSNTQERIDEYKIAAIHEIMTATINKRRAPSYCEMKALVARDMYYIWSAKRLTSSTKKRKRKEIAEACDYVCHQIGVKRIREAARSLVLYLQNNVSVH
jgi:hypothetical protein